MKLFLGYASTEGQTRKIMRHVADLLVDQGHSVELLPLADADGLNLDRFDRAILAASVHANHYQRALSDFAAAHDSWLSAHTTLFLSVSLAAAGHDAEDWLGLDRIVDDVTEATGWTPGQVAHIGGAYQPSKYDVVRQFVMRRIIAKKDPEVNPTADKEFTDWASLDATLNDWLAG